MPEPTSVRASAVWDALAAGGTPPSSKRKAALLDALREQGEEPQGASTAPALAEAAQDVVVVAPEPQQEQGEAPVTRAPAAPAQAPTSAPTAPTAPATG